MRPGEHDVSPAAYVASRTVPVLASLFFMVSSGAVGVLLVVNLLEGNVEREPVTVVFAVLLGLGSLAVFVLSFRLLYVSARHRFAVDAVGITRRSVYGDLHLPWESIRSARILLTVGYANTANPGPAAMRRRSRPSLQLALVDTAGLELDQPALTGVRIRGGSDDGYTHEFPLVTARVLASANTDDYAPDLQVVLLESAGEKYAGATLRNR